MIRRHIKDLLIAVVISILIGIVITILMGGSLKVSFTRYLWNAGYSLTIGLPLFANGFLFKQFEKRYIDWINHPGRSVAGALLLHFVYSSIVIWAVNWFWFVYVNEKDWRTLITYNKATIVSEYIIFIVIASIIYCISFFKAWRAEVQQKEEAKREALSLQYKVLQNQVNPHFLFNSLNVLGSLMDIDVEKAKHFNRELSHFYRQVLELKNKDIIPLNEEIAFVNRYIYLQQIRFGNALQVEIPINENFDGHVIPLSLQTLLENAIKHNEISMANPLKIIIAVTETGELIVENNLQPKQTHEMSSGTGLKNLAGRFEYLTGKVVAITQNDGYFRVSLPIIKLEN